MEDLVDSYYRGFPSYARINERFDGDIRGQRSVPQDTSFVTTRSRASDMHPQPHPHPPRLGQQRHSQPKESLEDIMEAIDLGDGRRSRYDSRSVIEGRVIFLYGCEN